MIPSLPTSWAEVSSASWAVTAKSTWRRSASLGVLCWSSSCPELSLPVWLAELCSVGVPEGEALWLWSLSTETEEPASVSSLPLLQPVRAMAAAAARPKVRVTNFLERMHSSSDEACDHGHPVHERIGQGIYSGSTANVRNFPAHAAAGPKDVGCHHDRSQSRGYRTGYPHRGGPAAGRVVPHAGSGCAAEGQFRPLRCAGGPGSTGYHGPVPPHPTGGAAREHRSGRAPRRRR